MLELNNKINQEPCIVIPLEEYKELLICRGKLEVYEKENKK